MQAAMNLSDETKRQLPIALRAAYMALHRQTNARLSELGITADQFVLLLALSEGSALTQRELAKRISSDPSTVRAMLVLLDKEQLIERTSHPTDSRAKSVKLTQAGKSKLRKAWKAGQSIRDAAYDCLSDKEAQTLTQLLHRVSHALKESTVDG